MVGQCLVDENRSISLRGAIFRRSSPHVSAVSGLDRRAHAQAIKRTIPQGIALSGGGRGMCNVRVSDSGFSMPSRTRAVLAFACIMVVIYCGMLNTSWWAAMAGACSLGVISLMSPLGALVNHQRLGNGMPASTLLISSCLNASATAAAAFVFGRVVGWFWGLDTLLTG